MNWKIGSGAALVLATGLIGFAHTKAGRPLLALLGGCPVSLDNADPAAVERYRIEQLRTHAGTQPATAHPALGFELGRTTRTDVERWAADRGAECEDKRNGSVLSCRSVIGERTASGCAPHVSDLHLQFDAEGRLVAVDLFRSTPDAETAIAHLEHQSRDLDGRVGPASQKSGELDADYLSAAPFRRAAREYRYSDYLAKLSVMHYPGGGMRVREQYQWLPG